MRNGLDVLQLLFLRYLQGCVNSCHHLLTLTGINCCFWISPDSLPAVVGPLLASILVPEMKLEQFLVIVSFSTRFSILCGNLWSLRLIILIVTLSLYLVVYIYVYIYVILIFCYYLSFNIVQLLRPVYLVVLVFVVTGLRGLFLM